MSPPASLGLGRSNLSFFFLLPLACKEIDAPGVHGVFRMDSKEGGVTSSLLLDLLLELLEARKGFGFKRS